MGGDYGAGHMGLSIDSLYDWTTLLWVETIGQRIRELRKIRGLTQVQLAKAIGIDQSTLSDIERGSGFSAEILLGFSESPGASPEFIMRGKEGNELALTPEERDIVLTLRERRIAGTDWKAGLKNRPTRPPVEKGLKNNDKPRKKGHA